MSNQHRGPHCWNVGRIHHEHVLCDGAQNGSRHDVSSFFRVSDLRRHCGPHLLACLDWEYTFVQSVQVCMNMRSTIANMNHPKHQSCQWCHTIWTANIPITRTYTPPTRHRAHTPEPAHNTRHIQPVTPMTTRRRTHTRTNWHTRTHTYHTPHHTPYHTPHHTPHHAPHHTTTYHAMPCHAMPCHAMPCHAMPHHTIPYHTIPYHTIPHNTTPYSITSYHIKTSHIRSCHIRSCRSLKCMESVPL